MIGGLTLLSLQVVSVPGIAAEPQAPAASPAAQALQVREQEFLLFAVELDKYTLTEALSAYGDPDDPLLPVGELSRLLELDVTVSRPDLTVTGRLGEARRSLVIDLKVGLVRINGNEVTLGAGDVAVSASDIFIRASALQRLLPLRMTIDGSGLLIKLEATEKLPIQSRIDRGERLTRLGNDIDTDEPVLLIASPYRLFSPPGVDVALEGGGESRGGDRRFPTRYDIRVAGDLLYTGFKGYLGSDETGTPSTARVEFVRRSRDGGLLGPLDATYFAAGDAYTPGLALGPRSGGGRGFSFTTGNLENTSVFQRINLRGELPIGYDVELYINDVLRSGQRSPVEGRYEFLDVPLVRGLNVIRVVTYGPRGERNEQTRVINVGGGQLARGETTLDFGIVQQDRPVIEFGDAEIRLANPNYEELRTVASIAHGLSEEVTLVGGVALYPGGKLGRRQLLSIGARGSLFGMAVQGDVARDQRNGMAGAIGVAGQPLGVSLVARHAEYRGGFIDENSRLFDANRPLSRHSEMTLDFTLPRIGGKIIPLSFRLERDAFADGGTSWSGISRASATIADMLISTGFDYRREDAPDTPTNERLAGNFAVSRFIDFKWQVRGVLDYDILPDTRLRALSLTADRDISERLGVRIGLGRSFGEQKDLSIQGGAFLRLPFADLAFTGDYMAAKNDWRVGLRLAFGLAFDPGIDNYRMTRPGPASGASAAFRAFIDSNADGDFDKGEEPVSGLVLEGVERKTATDKNGRAFVTGLGDSVSGRIRADIGKIDAFFVSAPPQNIEFSPRAGQVLDILYPLAPVGEVLARLRFRKADGEMVGLAAARIRLVADGVDPIEATTEFDGTALFTDIKPGTYRLEIDPVQAERLGMRLAAPVTVTVNPDGSSNDVRAEILFNRGPG